MIIEKRVLNKGYVRLISVNENEEFLSKIVRICYDKDEKELSEESSKRIIHTLLSSEHFSPFEFLFVIFKIKSPLFVARQLFRHRTGKYIEKSLRNVNLSFLDYYIPTIERLGNISEEEYNNFVQKLNNVYTNAFELYQTYIKLNFKKEVVRSVLPVGIYTEFYFGMDIRNLFNFLKQRLDSSAQYEIRVYAEAILEILKEKYPNIFEYFKI